MAGGTYPGRRFALLPCSQDVDTGRRGGAGAFKDRDGAMSTDWEKYSTVVQARNRARVPGDNAVVSFSAGDLRTKADLVVVHSPDVERNNRAHTEVKGEKDEEVRLILTRLMKWSLGLQGGR